MLDRVPGDTAWRRHPRDGTDSLHRIVTGPAAAASPAEERLEKRPFPANLCLCETASCLFAEVVANVFGRDVIDEIQRPTIDPSLETAREEGIEHRVRDVAEQRSVLGHGFANSPESLAAVLSGSVALGAQLLGVRSRRRVKLLDSLV